MHYKKLLISVSFISLIFSCNEEIKTTFLETNITTANNKLVEINVPKASGNNAVISQFNNEINKVIISALQIGEQDAMTSKSVEESITAFNDEYDGFNADFPNVSQPWEAQIDGEVLLQSSEIISIAMTTYVNTGGAHGITHISFLNFNTTTGKRIENNNLFKNENAFKNIAKSYFKDAIKEEDILFEPNKFKLPANIGFNGESVILLYNQYEIAPYSTGIIEFTIPIEKANEFLAFNGS